MFVSPFESKKKSENEIKLNLSLLSVESADWDPKFKNLMKDEYLARKYDRDKRLKEHIEYLTKLCPEMFQEGPHRGLNVIDIGPGPGELLEIARCLGYNSIGFDAKMDDCEMGSPYIELSKLLVERQKLDVRYCGFENILTDLPVEKNSTFLINSRGSIEQVFKDHLIGIPHRHHHDAKRLSWSMSEDMVGDFTRLFTEASKILIPGGFFIIHGNGTTNTREYHEMILKVTSEVDGIACDASDNQALHRIRKL